MSRLEVSTTLATEAVLWQRLRREIERCPFHALLGLSPIRADPGTGEVEIRMENRPELGLAHDSDAVHGGVLAALVDITAHATVACATNTVAPTIDLRVDYVRPAHGDALFATGTPIRIGRTIARVDVHISSQSGVVACLGRGTFYVAPE